MADPDGTRPHHPALGTLNGQDNRRYNKCICDGLIYHTAAYNTWLISGNMADNMRQRDGLPGVD